MGEHARQHVALAACNHDCLVFFMCSSGLHALQACGSSQRWGQYVYGVLCNQLLFRNCSSPQLYTSSSVTPTDCSDILDKLQLQHCSFVK